jgi:type IV pilus assembly protein PilW
VKNKYDQIGFSLVEIMIALLIGAFLLGGMLQIMLASKQTYRMQQALSRLQENGRFAIDVLASDIRMAGFKGCNSGVPITNQLKTATAFVYSFGKSIEGFDSVSGSAWSPSINSAITSPLGGTDVVTIRRASDQGFSVINHSTPSAKLELDAAANSLNLKSAGFLNSGGINNCAIAIVTDCSLATIFQVTAISGNLLSHIEDISCSPGNQSGDLGKTYVGAHIYPINTITYYVSKNTNGQPTLYHKVGSNNAEELMEGIENMQITYGLDTDSDGSVNQYLNSTSHWEQVISVRIVLTVRTTEDNLISTPRNYIYEGATVSDRRLTRDFTATIGLRNRLR